MYSLSLEECIGTCLHVSDFKQGQTLTAQLSMIIRLTMQLYILQNLNSHTWFCSPQHEMPCTPHTAKGDLIQWAEQMSISPDLQPTGIGHYHRQNCVSVTHSWSPQHLVHVPYSEKLSRQKTFVNFTVLWLFAQVFSAKFGGAAPLVLQKRAIHGSFLCENRIFHQFTKVSRYTVLAKTLSTQCMQACLDGDVVH